MRPNHCGLVKVLICFQFNVCISYAFMQDLEENVRRDLRALSSELLPIYFHKCHTLGVVGEEGAVSVEELILRNMVPK